MRDSVAVTNKVAFGIDLHELLESGRGEFSLTLTDMCPAQPTQCNGIFRLEFMRTLEVNFRLTVVFLIVEDFTSNEQQWAIELINVQACTSGTQDVLRFALRLINTYKA